MGGGQGNNGCSFFFKRRLVFEKKVPNFVDRTENKIEAALAELNGEGIRQQGVFGRWGLLSHPERGSYVFCRIMYWIT